MTFRLAAIDARYPTVVQLEIPTGVEDDCLRVLFVSGPQAVPQLNIPSRPSLDTLTPPKPFFILSI